MSAFEWFVISQTVVMVIATAIIWSLRKSAALAVNDAELHRRIAAIENETERLRKWRHDVITPWQTKLLLELDERYILRREQGDDSPWPQNRRKPR